MQLVKEIPDFLFREASPENGGAGLDGEGAGPGGECTAGGPSASTRDVPCTCRALVESPHYTEAQVACWPLRVRGSWGDSGF